MIRRGWLIAQICMAGTACTALAASTTAHADEVLWNARGDEVLWHSRTAFGNDQFTDFDPPIDDAGFTHDNFFSLRREQGDYLFGGSFFYRWITSTDDQRRWDQVELFATAERKWPYPLV